MTGFLTRGKLGLWGVFSALKNEGVSRSVMSDSLWLRVFRSTRHLCPWDSPGKNTRVSCYSFSRGSSQPRNQTHIDGFYVSCIGRWVLYHSLHLGSPTYSDRLSEKEVKGWHNLIHVLISSCVYVGVCVYMQREKRKWAENEREGNVV